MATKTSNLYGKITVTNKAICSMVNMTVAECYGVGSGRVTDILTDNNKIYLSIKVYLKFGVKPEAISETIRKAVRFNVEDLTGMSVAVINVTVQGIY